jgi:hypothetical protein
LIAIGFSIPNKQNPKSATMSPKDEFMQNVIDFAYGSVFTGLLASPLLINFAILVLLSTILCLYILTFCLSYRIRWIAIQVVDTVLVGSVAVVLVGIFLWYCGK